jgi:hypothetical protein
MFAKNEMREGYISLTFFNGPQSLLRSSVSFRTRSPLPPEWPSVPCSTLYSSTVLCPLYGPLSHLRPSGSTTALCPLRPSASSTALYPLRTSTAPCPLYKTCFSHWLAKWWCCSTVSQNMFQRNGPFRERAKQVKRPLLFREIAKRVSSKPYHWSLSSLASYRFTRASHIWKCKTWYVNISEFFPSCPPGWARGRGG